MVWELGARKLRITVSVTRVMESRLNREGRETRKELTDTKKIKDPGI